MLPSMMSFMAMWWVPLAFVHQAAANTCTASEIPTLLASHATSASCWTVIVVNRQRVPGIESRDCLCLA